uniref:Uncharacterized protein n=1 Tax=viral metagenome TaxID=1070528 RepID=A0A6C0EHZ7_9ZZZZ
MDTDKLALTLLRVEDLIINDNNNDICYINDIKNSIKILLEGTNIIEKITYEIYQVTKNLEIDINDIPIILNIILDFKNLISQCNFVFKIKTNKISMKYYIFSILYYILIQDGKISEKENEILNKFEILWKFISYDSDILSKVEKDSCNSLYVLKDICFSFCNIQLFK